MPSFDFLQNEYYGNSLSAYLWAGAAFAAAFGAYFVARRLARASSKPLVRALIEEVRLPELLVVAVFFAERSLDLPYRLVSVIHVVTVVVVAYRVVTLLSTAAGYAIRWGAFPEQAGPADLGAARTATVFARGVIWVCAFLFVLENFGFNVSSMVAGLGIGGIAVALAAQAVLGDLFASIAIHLDKPFVVDDFIKVGDSAGTVERIGVKTTRVRSQNGELLVYPNSSLTTARVQNFKRMSERRVLFTFSVPQDTPTATLKKLPGQIEALVKAAPLTRFDRAHLSAFRESGLEFEVAFYVQSADYNVYMDGQQAVLVGLLETLRADGIPLAEPTRNIVVEGKLA